MVTSDNVSLFSCEAPQCTILYNIKPVSLLGVQPPFFSSKTKTIQLSTESIKSGEDPRKKDSSDPAQLK